MIPVGRTITIHDGKILLLRNKYPDGEFWGFPGGWQEDNEAPEECAARETQEETNLKVKIIKPLYTHEFIDSKRHLKTKYFLAKPVSDSSDITIENDPDKTDKKPQEVKWVPIRALKSLKMRPAEFIDKLLQDYEEDFPRFSVIPRTRV